MQWLTTEVLVRRRGETDEPPGEGQKQVEPSPNNGVSADSSRGQTHGETGDGRVVA